MFFTRLLVIPSLIVAPWLLTKTSSRRVQFIGFAGCAVINLLLAVAYEPLQKIHWFFITLYLCRGFWGPETPEVSKKRWPHVATTKPTMPFVATTKPQLLKLLDTLAFSMVDSSNPDPMHLARALAHCGDGIANPGRLTIRICIIKMF